MSAIKPYPKYCLTNAMLFLDQTKRLMSEQISITECNRFYIYSYLAIAIHRIRVLRESIREFTHRRTFPNRCLLFISLNVEQFESYFKKLIALKNIKLSEKAYQ